MHQNPEHFALLSYLGTLAGNGVVPGLQDVPDAHGVHLDPVLAASIEGLAAVQLGGQVLPQVCLPEVGVGLGSDGVLVLEGQVIPQVLLPGLIPTSTLARASRAPSFFQGSTRAASTLFLDGKRSVVKKSVGLRGFSNSSGSVWKTTSLFQKSVSTSVSVTSPSQSAQFVSSTISGESAHFGSLSTLPSSSTSASSQRQFHHVANYAQNVESSHLVPPRVRYEPELVHGKKKLERDG